MSTKNSVLVAGVHGVSGRAAAEQWASPGTQVYFQVRSDGSVRECDDDVLSPFAVVTRFAPEAAVTLGQCPVLSHLTARFDGRL